MPSASTITTRAAQAKANAMRAPIARRHKATCQTARACQATTSPEPAEYTSLRNQPQQLPRCTCRYSRPRLFADNTAAQTIADHFLDQPDLKVFHPSQFTLA
jgi:hypothetical protein